MVTRCLERLWVGELMKETIGRKGTCFFQTCRMHLTRCDMSDILVVLGDFCARAGELDQNNYIWRYMVKVSVTWQGMSCWSFVSSTVYPLCSSEERILS